MFLSKSNDEYKYLIGLMEGKTEPSPLLHDLQEWFYDKYAIRLYGYLCDEIESGSAKGQLRLKVVLFDYDDVMKMRDGANLDRRKQCDIRNKFAELAIRYQCHAAYQSPEEVFVCYESLKDEIWRRILGQAEWKIKAIQHKYKDIWEIGMDFQRVHVFYKTDEQMARHRLDGTDDKINQTVSEIVKKYDKYGIMKQGIRCTFTSKETLDRDYRGNLFFYYR